MLIIHDATISDDRQVCTKCKWQGGKYDEPTPLCPLCWHAVKIEVWSDNFFAYSSDLSRLMW